MTLPMKDMKGQRIGRLTVLRYAGHSTHRPGARWVARCDCGKVEVWDGNYLRKAERKFPTVECKRCREQP